jgi:GT2 family glycosyltransferase
MSTLRNFPIRISRPSTDGDAKQRATVTAARVPSWPRPAAGIRPVARGKFLFVGDEKLYLCGVTYGTFAPDPHGDQFPEPDVVRADFVAMASSGINALRTYTVPPLWLLDLAQDAGLWVMAGLPWEQHVAFLDERDRPRSILASVRAAAHACAGHPALLCFAVGNEIPASIVRWHGRRRVERFLTRLHAVVKQEDPGALVTYVNFPSTEYLDLPFADFLCFNVYLESRSELVGYLARLQNLAGDRPLVMAEIGLDSDRNGESEQAATLDWQVGSAFAAGCAGAFIFSWTDEWHRGGFDIDDWAFGLVRRDRSPKPALEAARGAFARVPLRPDSDWPRISIAVCTHNGAATIAECLDALGQLDYPSREVIVVDDGSTDATASIVEAYEGVRLIRTPNAGLASARNTALAAARGEIVAYIDDDAFPDRQWLTYLAHTFMTTVHGAVGGPNVPPDDEGFVARCVANSPGGPTHVLTSDAEAEHIPGCNMAIRTEVLRAIGGFDARFRAAGDDVDVCWRLHDNGETIGFSPAATVWHRRRASIRGYLRQQLGYGRAEALLEEKWPEKYNDVGHPRWGGRLYGGQAQRVGRRQRVRYGTWGSGAFQSVYDSPAGMASQLTQTPEWYLVIALLAALSMASIARHALVFALPLLALALAPVLVRAGRCARIAVSREQSYGRRRERAALWLLTYGLHLAQPVVRLRGRFGHGLTPWRPFAPRGRMLPLRRNATIWSESWAAPEWWLSRLETALRTRGVPVARGGDFDTYDLRVRGGLGLGARIQMAVEEHGSGRQLLRFRITPRSGVWAPGLVAGIAALGALVADEYIAPGLVLIAASAAFGLLALRRCAAAVAVTEHAIESGELIEPAVETTTGPVAGDVVPSRG